MRLVEVYITNHVGNPITNLPFGWCIPPIKTCGDLGMVYYIFICIYIHIHHTRATWMYIVSVHANSIKHDTIRLFFSNNCFLLECHTSPEISREDGAFGFLQSSNPLLLDALGISWDHDLLEAS